MPPLKESIAPVLSDATAPDSLLSPMGMSGRSPIVGTAAIRNLATVKADIDGQITFGVL